MNPATITHSVSKTRNHAATVNLFKSMIPEPIVRKQPAPFASALAHEVRNPLSNINLAVEMLKSGIIDFDQKVYLDIIMRSSNRITDLINELLQYQLAEEIQGEKHSIHLLLDEVIDMAGDRIKLKNIAVSKEYAEHDCKLVLNRPKMKIALTNIIINAIDAMIPSKGELKLVSKSMEGKYILQIEDNGCGISKGNLKYMFTPYYTNKPGGLGLGLATTYDILRSNHVKVNIESQEGLGTRFILIFDKKHHYSLFKK